MFGWLRNRRQRREIFSFFDGQKTRRVDPMVIIRGLETQEKFDWSQHPVMVAKTGDTEALQITAEAVRKVFDVPVFDGQQGLTESECLELLALFTQYLEELKKSTNPSLILDQFTESPAVPMDSLTNSSSDSGSTSNDKKPASPPESGTVSG